MTAILARSAVFAIGVTVIVIAGHELAADALLTGFGLIAIGGIVLQVWKEMG